MAQPAATPGEEMPGATMRLRSFARPSTVAHGKDILSVSNKAERFGVYTCS